MNILPYLPSLVPLMIWSNRISAVSLMARSIRRVVRFTNAPNSSELMMRSTCSELISCCSGVVNYSTTLQMTGLYIPITTALCRAGQLSGSATGCGHVQSTPPIASGPSAQSTHSVSFVWGLSTLCRDRTHILLSGSQCWGFHYNYTRVPWYFLLQGSRIPLCCCIYTYLFLWLYGVIFVWVEVRALGLFGGEFSAAVPFLLILRSSLVPYTHHISLSLLSIYLHILEPVREVRVQVYCMEGH